MRPTDRTHLATLAAVLVVVCTFSSQVDATEVTGTIHLTGLVVFAAPIPGIDPEDLDVTVKSTTDATGNGEKCTILSVTSDHPDAGGAYPDMGDVNAEITIERGGPNVPQGSCLVTVQASGNDGLSVSARGSQTVFVDVTQIGSNATVPVPDIVVRQSKAMAGVDDDCRKWFRKQLKKRAKCNFLLLKKGVEVATKCTDAGPEPAGCDPADYTAAILALSHGETDQQTDPGSAQAVGSEALTDQVKCQKFFGKAAANFANKLVTLVQKECIDAGVDSESCRNTQSNSAKSRLDAIDNCTADQQLDVDSGLLVPDADPPCDECIDMAGIIDQKCLKDCFRTNIEELADGVIGDIPECGDGILQQGEFCDDGNLTDGDGCNSLCQVE